MGSNISVLSSTRRVLSFFSARQRGLLVLIIMLALCTAILEMLCAGILVKLTQAIIDLSQGPVFFEKFGMALNEQQALLYLGLILLVIYALKNLVSLVDVTVQNFGIRRMNCQLQRWFLERFQHIDYQFLKSRPSSYGMTVVQADTEIVFSRGVLSLTAIVTELLVFLGLVAVLAYLNLSLILVLAALCLLIAGAMIKFGLPYMYALGKKNEAAALNKNTNMMKYFQGYKEILLSGQSEYFIESYLKHLRASTHVAATSNVFAVVPRALIELTFLGAFVGSFMLVDLEKTDMGFLGAYAYAAFRIMPGLNRIINLTANFKSSIPFINRIGDEYDRLSQAHAYQSAPGLTFNNQITLQGVNFQYAASSQPVLKDLNLTINKGEFIGIVGDTGSGKSTLLNIILGLLPPTTGQALVDGQYPLNSREWHQKIGYVPQSTYIVEGTIEDNIAFGRNGAEIDAARLQKVIEQAQLSDLIRRLDNGTKTHVGEFGSAISGGEQQRIAIARALYKQPEILILDEATSALDRDTESRLVEMTNAIGQDITIIMIAHRLESLRYCRRIIRVEGGSLIEVGTYQDLVGQRAS